MNPAKMSINYVVDFVYQDSPRTFPVRLWNLLFCGLNLFPLPPSLFQGTMKAQQRGLQTSIFECG
jgi:hypothetical protein